MTTKNSLQIDLKQALTKLEESLDLQKTDISRDASIQRFEFVFELSWKLMSEIIKDQSKEPFTGVKNTIRSAANLGLIDNPSDWFTYLEARNLTVHTYDEKIANQVYDIIKNFPILVHSLLKSLPKYL